MTYDDMRAARDRRDATDAEFARLADLIRGGTPETRLAACDEVRAKIGALLPRQARALRQMWEEATATPPPDDELAASLVFNSRAVPLARRLIPKLARQLGQDPKAVELEALAALGFVGPLSKLREAQGVELFAHLADRLEEETPIWPY